MEWTNDTKGYEAAIADATTAPTPDALEQVLVQDAQRRLRSRGARCCGKTPRYNHGVGAARCESCGSLYTTSGALIRSGR